MRYHLWRKTIIVWLVLACVLGALSLPVERVEGLQRTGYRAASTYLQGLPATGQVQANDWLAWGALVACAAIAAGLVLIALRRRKGGDGL